MNISSESAQESTLSTLWHSSQHRTFCGWKILFLSSFPLPPDALEETERSERNAPRQLHVRFLNPNDSWLPHADTVLSLQQARWMELTSQGIYAHLVGFASSFLSPSPSSFHLAVQQSFPRKGFIENPCLGIYSGLSHKWWQHRNQSIAIQFQIFQQDDYNKAHDSLQQE